MIDGTPRSLAQAMVLNDGLEFYNRRANIIHLDISPETSRQRLLERGRSDDVLTEKVNRRLEWFDQEVMPAIEYLKTQSGHNYMKINGEQPIEKVHADILAGLKTNWSSGK
jgi:adenylate kinase family enzyme